MGSQRVRAFRDDVVSLLAPLLAGFAQRFGYEPGNNTVVLASENENAAVLRTGFGDRLPVTVREFFDTVAQVSLPDIHNGFFLGPPSWIVGVHAAEEPARVELNGESIDVLVVGSDGGGSLYAVPLPTGAPVYRLPLGAIESGCYQGLAVAIADDFGDFLDKVVRDLRSLVTGDATAEFLVL